MGFLLYDLTTLWIYIYIYNVELKPISHRTHNELASNSYWDHSDIYQRLIFGPHNCNPQAHEQHNNEAKQKKRYHLPLPERQKH